MTVDEVIFRDPKVIEKDAFREKIAIAGQVYIWTHAWVSKV